MADKVLSEREEANEGWSFFMQMALNRGMMEIAQGRGNVFQPGEAAEQVLRAWKSCWMEIQIYPMTHCDGGSRNTN